MILTFKIHNSRAIEEWQRFLRRCILAGFCSPLKVHVTFPASVHIARSARPSNLRLTFPKLISLGQVNPPSKSLISPLNDKYPNNEKIYKVSALRGTLEVWWALIFLTRATDFVEKLGLLWSIISVKRLINSSFKVLATFTHAKQYSLQLRWFCPMRYFL